MRCFVLFATMFALGDIAHAQSPPPDNSPGFFSGEWSGTGEHGSYCYLRLNADGSGWVLSDGGSGDWLGAGVPWRDRQQSLQVDTIIPARASVARRVIMDPPPRGDTR